jgi:hypothetical protein
MERPIDAAARQCGFDRAELRRISMVPAASMPIADDFRDKIGDLVDMVPRAAQYLVFRSREEIYVHNSGPKQGPLYMGKMIGQMAKAKSPNILIIHRD